MATDDKLTIKLLIAETYYPLTIDRKDEEFIREAARRINDKLNRYRKRYPNLSSEKYLAMVALHIAVMNLDLEKKNDTRPFKEKIEEQILKLDDYLKLNKI